jgi:hypothetical protein
MSDPVQDVGPALAEAEVGEKKGAAPIHDRELEHKPHVPNSVNDETDLYEGEPTDEELATLRRIPGRIPWICFTVAFVELCERFAYYGTTAVSMYPNSSNHCQCIISNTMQ